KATRARARAGRPLAARRTRRRARGRGAPEPRGGVATRRSLGDVGAYEGRRRAGGVAGPDRPRLRGGAGPRRLALRLLWAGVSAITPISGPTFEHSSSGSRPTVR